MNSQSIIKNLKKYQATTIAYDLNCPNLNHMVLSAFYKNKDNLANKILDTNNILDMLANYRIISRDVQISNQDLAIQITKIKTILEEKKAEAAASSKKVLIVLGESHDFQKSILGELILLTLLKSEGYTSLLVEFSEKELNDVKLSRASGTKFTFNTLEVAEKVLDYKIIPVDPLKAQVRDIDLDSPKYIKRTDSINQEIAKNNNQDQVCQIGATHLLHIANSPEINQKFVILPINLSMDFGQDLPAESTYMAGFAKYIDTEIKINALEGSFHFNLPSSLEPFPFKVIFQIYTELLPWLLNDVSELPTKAYSTKFSDVQAKCEGMDLEAVAAKMLSDLLTKLNPHYKYDAPEMSKFGVTTVNQHGYDVAAHGEMSNSGVNSNVHDNEL